MFERAEAACDSARGGPTGAERYGMLLERVDGLIQKAAASLTEWEAWIPCDRFARLEGRVEALESLGINLAEFLTTKRIAVEGMREESQPAVVPQAVVPLPVVRLGPTRLPKFTGSKRNFYSCWSDWENLQRQGESSGSAEAKKFQLIDSVDERVSRDLRLSTYDIFRVLQNRFGNNESIAMEVIEDLKRFPPLKPTQPRRVIDFIQALEKALCDLTELESAGAIKNPLIIRSIESKLPDDLKKD